MNQPVLVTKRRVREAHPIDHRLLHTVCDDQDQEGHAVRVVLAKAEPLGKLGAKLEPLLAVCNNVLWNAGRDLVVARLTPSGPKIYA